MEVSTPACDSFTEKIHSTFNNATLMPALFLSEQTLAAIEPIILHNNLAHCNYIILIKLAKQCFHHTLFNTKIAINQHVYTKVSS
jgi:hypothetical protein